MKRIGFYEIFFETTIFRKELITMEENVRPAKRAEGKESDYNASSYASYPSPYIGAEMQLSNIQQQMYRLDSNVVNVLTKVRKQHRKMEDCDIWVDKASKSIMFLQTYSDGTCSPKILIYNMGGEIEVQTLYIGTAKFFWLRMGQHPWIKLDAKDMKESELYEALIRAGVDFNPTIGRSKISSALYRYLAPMYEAEVNTKVFSGLPGWENREYLSAESFALPYKCIERAKDVPVLKKAFNKEMPNLARIDNYVNLLANIENEQIRLLVSLIPFAGITYSIFKSVGKEHFFLPNFILVSDKVKSAEIAAYLQIYNRKSGIHINSLEDSNKNILRVLDEAKDEVIMYQGLEDEDMTNYQGKKMTKNLKMISKISSGRSANAYGHKAVEGVVVFFSNQYLDQAGVKNIFVEDGLFKQQFTPEEFTAVDDVLALFVWYVEQQYDYITSIVTKENAEDRDENYWQCLLSIVQTFWKAHNTTLEKVLNLSQTGYEHLWQENPDDAEDEWEALVHAMRVGIADITVTEKHNACGGEDAIVDQEYLYIRPHIFDAMLKKSMMTRLKNEMLLKAKLLGNLITETDAFTMRVQKHGIRKEYYQFKLSEFTKVGQVDLIDLAKEVV